MADIAASIIKAKNSVLGPDVLDAVVEIMTKVNDEATGIVNKKGVPNGYAALGSDGKVPAAQLPPASAGTGIGDMTKTIYDLNNDGIVDNAEKVNGLTVLTAVPAGAAFTDTVTTINGKTGIIQKEDIIALGIQAAIAFTPENTANKGQINGYAGLGSDGKVPAAQLPAAAEGHTHANKSILDKITAGTATTYDLDAFVTDADLVNLGAGDMLKSTYDTTGNGIVDNAEKVNYKTVETSVPAGAVFTDTVTSINGKTGIIQKSDITALGIPAQDNDTIYSHPAYTPHESGLYKITTDVTGHVSATTPVAKADIIALGITEGGVTAADLALLEYSKFSSYGTNIDANGLYVNNEWKRPDGTTYCKSTLIGTTPTYNQITVDYYNAAGTTIINTITWNLNYDSNKFVYQKVVI